MAYTYGDFLKKAKESNTLGEFSKRELSLAHNNPEYGISAASLKQDKHNANSGAQRALADQTSAQLFSSYNGFVGSKQDEIEDILDKIGSFGDFQYGVQAPSYENKYKDKQDDVLGQIGDYKDFEYDKEAPTYTNPYEQLQKDLLDKILNRKDFTWDKDTDPVFGEYQKQYLREGERATANALAQAAVASGGQASSYAAQAAAQAGNYYAGKLSDKIPELYNQAYQRYLSEYELMIKDLGAVNNQQQLDYKAYLDRLGQYNKDRDFAYKQYVDEYNRLLGYLDALNGQEQMDYKAYLDRLGQYNKDKDYAYKQYIQEYNKLKDQLGGLQKVNDTEYRQYVDQQKQEQQRQQQSQKAARTQVDGILRAGTMPSASLIAQSGYSQEYVNAMLQHYRSQKAAAKRGSSGGGKHGGTQGSKPTTSGGFTPKKHLGYNGLVSTPQYGEMSVADAEKLVSAGLLRRNGLDKYGKPLYTATTKQPSGHIQISR